jgi:hypothetical protein
MKERDLSKTEDDNIKMDIREVACGLDPSDSGQGPVAGCCEHGNEVWGLTKGEENLDQPSDHQQLKMSVQTPLVIVLNTGKLSVTRVTP